MISADIAQFVRDRVAEDLDVVQASPDRVAINTPFMYQDGDHCAFVFLRGESGWVLTDEGEVLEHAGYAGVDLLGEGREPRFRKTARFFGVREEDGALVLPVESEREFGRAFFAFAQACLEIINLTKIPREHKKTEKPALRAKLSTILVESKGNWTQKWHHEELDPGAVYVADYRAVARDGRDVLLFGPTTPIACWRSATTCLHYRNAQHSFLGVAVYENEDALGGSAAAALDSAVDKSFPSVDRGGEEIVKFLKTHVA